MGNDKARENSLWGWLSKARLVFREKVDLERVENMIGSGHPDVRGICEGAHFYIELKSVPRPTRKTLIDATLRKEQVDWMERYEKAGGRNGFLLIQVGSGVGYAARYLIEGHHFRHLFENRVDEEWFVKHSLTRWNDGQAVVITAATE